VIIALMVGLIFTAAPNADAATLLWTNTAGGSWTTAANWSPNQVPTGLDDAFITNSGAYAVAVTTADANSVTLGGGLGTQTLNLTSGTLAATDLLHVLSNGVLNWSGGTLQSPVVVDLEATVIASGTVTFLGPSILNSGTFINNATLRMHTSNAGFTNLAGGTVYLTNSVGTINSILGAVTNQFIANFGHLISAQNHTIPFSMLLGGQVEIQSGELGLGNAGATKPTNTVTGNITVAAGATMALPGGGTFNLPNGAVMSGAGSLRANDAESVANISGSYELTGPLRIESGTVNFETGTPKVLDTVLFAGGRLGGSDPILITNVLEWSSGGTFSGSAPVGLAETAQAVFSSPIALKVECPAFLNAGSIQTSTGIALNAPGVTFTNQPTGKIILTNRVSSSFSFLSGGSAGNRLFVNEGLIRNVASNILVTSSAPILNMGVIRCETNTLQFDPSLIQTAGSIELLGGNIRGSTSTRHLVLQGGSLIGSGFVNEGNVTNIAGVVSPGALTGTLHIVRNYTQLEGGTLHIDLGGTQAGNEYDQLQVDGTANLAGRLAVTNVGGYFPTTNDLFSILESGGVNGAFSELLSESIIYDVEAFYEANRVDIRLFPPVLTLLPPSASVITNDLLAFTADGGIPPYSYSLAVNNSGGTINAESGLYTAGPISDVSDTVQVEDFIGTLAQSVVNVVQPPPHLVFLNSPNNGAALLNLTPAVMVMAQDHLGNLAAVTNDITLSLGNNPSGDTLQGTLTVPAVGGMAEFNAIWLNRAGNSYTLVASAEGLTSGESAGFDVAEPEFVVMSLADDGEKSFRRLLNAANAQTGAEPVTITFGTTGTIHPQSALPVLIHAVNIKGTNLLPSLPLIRLDGSFLVTGTPGLRLLGNGSSVRDMAFYDFPGDAIIIEGFDTVIAGCLFGREDFGSAPNLGFGIVSTASNTCIGGANQTDRNIFYASGAGGILLAGNRGQVIGNLIGLDENDNVGGTGGPGVLLSNVTQCVVGGGSPERRNVISGNSIAGIQVSGVQCQSNTIIGNFIGTELSGESSLFGLGNVGAGILVDGGATYLFVGVTNIVGTVNDAQANVIAFNHAAGIHVAAGTNVVIRGNDICRNAGLDIQLGAGNAPPDIGDTFPGPNGLQNRPDPIQVLQPGQSPIIRATLSSQTNKTYVLDFYVQAGCLNTRTHIGARTITTDENGLGVLDMNDFATFLGESISATATSEEGNTSEFTECQFGPITTVTGDVFDQTFSGGEIGVTIAIAGLQSGSAQTDASGEFELYLPLDDTGYTLTPSKAGYVYSPAQEGLVAASREYGPYSFAADIARVKISGHLTETNGSPIPLASISVTLTDGRVLTGYLTDPDGYYELTVPALSDYVVTASYEDSLFDFVPPFVELSNLLTNQTLDFVGFPVAPRAMGQIRDSTGENQPGVVMVLTSVAPPAPSQIMQTSSQGLYQFNGLVPGSSYVLTPVLNGRAFDPPSLSFKIASDDIIQNFTNYQGFLISGRLTNSAGAGIENLPLLFTLTDGTIVTSSQTDSSGSYASLPLIANRTYQVLPKGVGYSFTPTSLILGPLFGNQSNKDFLGSNILFSARGRVTNSAGFGLSSGSVNCSWGIERATPISESGDYLLPNLPSLGNYLISPNRAGFNFDPDTLPITNLLANIVQNYRAEPALPLEGRISFIRNSTLYVMNADSSDLVRTKTQLPKGTSFTTRPTYSPDGRFIALTMRTSAGGEALYISSADGTSTSQLTMDKDIVQNPSWSPDGNRLAFAMIGSSSGEPPGLYLVETNGANPTLVPGTKIGDVEPNFAPNGQELIFSRLSRNICNIMRVGTNGGALTMMVRTSGDDRTPVWSPDGTAVAFSSTFEGLPQIYVFDVLQSKITRLSNKTASEIVPVWSPDGSMIAYETEQAGVRQIAAMAADGSQKTILATGLRPSWSLRPVIPTPAGLNKTVEDGSVDINFDNVTTAGETSILPVPAPSSGSLPPGYFTLPGANVSYEISTTAGFSGPVTLCFTVSNINSVAVFNSLRVLHAESGQLIDRTILSGPDAPDFATRRICALVNSFSPFTVAMLADPALARIEGQLMDADGVPIPDAQIELADSEGLALTTDIEGYFTFANLPVGSNYVLVASKPGFTFTPAATYFTNLHGTNAVTIVGQPEIGPSLVVDLVSTPEVHIRIQWPSMPGGYILEQADDPDSTWTTTLAFPSITNSHYEVTLPVDVTKRFYRLRQQ